MSERKPLVLIDGTISELPVNDSISGLPTSLGIVLSPLIDYENSTPVFIFEYKENGNLDCVVETDE